ncbi:YigZ family protein [Actinomyces sp. MRS3W]|uniref:IMPACT family protein n=1 Tax=Actinomyces sp. MRS3W TaxID=2800796 RepID=UPI0028FD7234|nr:YigZ family protein [Actinomyces sp. MRS3W]MDU0348834.1 YigZ family protein [Actinomyces sp. MRS3W]
MSTSSFSPADADPSGVITLARGEQPETDLEVKRSHFLGQAARTDDEAAARVFIAAVRARYPDARHHCSAFTVAVPGAQPIERSSDDGEPSGTAGGPMLDVLRGTGLTNTTVVVTRYFGGTLLGTGGLARAYTQAATQALEAAARVRLATRYLWKVRVAVADAGRLEGQLRGRAPEIAVEETNWTATHAVLTLSTGSADPTGLTEQLAALTAGAAVPEPAGSRVVESPV